MKISSMAIPALGDGNIDPLQLNLPKPKSVVSWNVML
jgi:hypothetical protein